MTHDISAGVGCGHELREHARGHGHGHVHVTVDGQAIGVSIDQLACTDARGFLVTRHISA